MLLVVDGRLTLAMTLAIALVLSMLYRPIIPYGGPRVRSTLAARASSHATPPAMLSTECASKGGTLVFFVLATLRSWLIDLGTLWFQSDRAKELEILLLRRCEKLGLAVLASKLHCLPADARSLVRASLVLITPETVLRRHRELVRRK